MNKYLWEEVSFQLFHVFQVGLFELLEMSTIVY